MKSNEEWSSQLLTQFFMQLRKKPEKKIQDFNGIWTRDLAIPVRRSNQLSYKAIDVVGGQAILEWKRMFFQLFCDFNLISNSF